MRNLIWSTLALGCVLVGGNVASASDTIRLGGPSAAAAISGGTNTELVRGYHGGYRGYYCFEWEKRWHPEIPEPDIAFPHYAKVMREYLTEAGVKA